MEKIIFKNFETNKKISKHNSIHDFWKKNIFSSWNFFDRTSFMIQKKLFLKTLKQIKKFRITLVLVKIKKNKIFLKNPQSSLNILCDSTNHDW